MVRLIEATTKRQLKAFVKFPINLYRDNAQYVPGLIADDLDTFDQDKNPAFEFCEAKFWLAMDHGEVVGRIAAIINHKAIQKYGEKRGRFGFIDFIDDREVSGLLLETAENWLREKGMNLVQGPLGFSDLDEEGLLTDGFNEMGTLTTIYNHAYYQDHLAWYGYEEDVKWLEYEGELPENPDPRVSELAERIMKKYDLSVVKLNRSKDVLPYANQLFELINRSYSELYNITPLDEKQMAYYTKKYFSFIKPDFVKLIVDGNNQLISFGLGFPSLSVALQKARGRLFPFGLFHIYRAFKKNDRVEMLLIAVDPDYSRKGVPAILIKEFLESFKANGIKYADLNPQLEENMSVRNLWKNYSLRQHRKRSCFIKNL